MNEMRNPGLAGMGDAMPVSSKIASPGSLAFETASYVEWQSIFVGAVVALAVAFVLLTFGAAVGLSAVSPWTSTRASIAAVSIGAGFWMILVHVWAFALGGYLAGRMRHRHAGTVPSEVEFRDGAHGAAVWGLAITFGAVVAAMVAGLAAQGVNTSASRGNDPITVATDTLLRTTKVSPAGVLDDVRGELGRLLGRSIGPAQLASADRAYLSEVVAARTGIAPADADRRVGEVVAQLNEATNRARKTGVVVGFITAATLLLGAAAAWWAASVGGKHRDENTLWAGFARHGQTRSMWSQT